jgi:tetratricopeptide (TPR) repeat protein
VFDLLSWIAISRYGGAEVRRWAPRVEALLAAAEASAGRPADPQVATRLRLILGGAWRNTAPAHSLAIWRDALARPRFEADRVLRFRLACCAATAAARTGQTEEADAQWRDACALIDPAWPPRMRLLEADAAGFVAHFAGDSASAREHFARFRALALLAGADGGLMVVSHNLADIALSLGEVDEAVRIGRELVAWLRTQRSPFNLGFALGNLFAALVQQGEHAAALEAGTEALTMLRRDENAVWLFDHFALLAARQGAYDAAARLLGYADKARETTGTPRDTSEAQACQMARTAVDAALGAPQREQLGAEGAALDDHRADALAIRPRPC